MFPTCELMQESDNSIHKIVVYTIKSHIFCTPCKKYLFILHFEKHQIVTKKLEYSINLV